MRNIEAFGCGCAVLDYDDDGWMDILLVTKPHPILYHNRGNGTFEDVTAATGFDQLKADWKGCGVGDYDGDGRLDIILTGYRRLALMHNVGGKRFEEVTAQAGLDPGNRNHWGSSAAFMDLDGSGKLALIILNYVVFGPKEQQYCELASGIKSGCPPHVYRPEFPELWENLGNGKFRDITTSSGMKQTSGKSLVVAFADVDNDGKMDFYIGNDGTPAEYMHNRGGLKFENLGQKSGLFASSMGKPIAAMGADWADYNRDGKLDLAVSAFADETYALFRNMGGNLFSSAEEETNIAGATLKPLGFGTKWIDIDNDGFPDVIFSNGHVYDNAGKIDPLSTYRQPIMIFHNEGGRTFRDLVPQMGPAVGKPLVGRGSATADFDNDGRMDELVVDYEGPPMLLHNVSATPNHWITLDLRSSGKNRFAYGSRITVKAGGQSFVSQVSPASSYLSSSDPRVHFGLGLAAQIDSIMIRWPSGHEEIIKAPPLDHNLRIVEGGRNKRSAISIR